MGTQSLNRGSRSKLPCNNEHFNLGIMDIGLEVGVGYSKLYRLIGRWFKTNSFERYHRISSVLLPLSYAL